MPKINAPRAAAVYAPGGDGAQQRLHDVLTARRLYALDCRSESIEDLLLPVIARPVLRLFLLHAQMGESGAEVFVADSLADLGNAEAERVAVVGALLQVGCEVFIGGEELDSGWYRPRVQRLGFPAVGPVIDRLLSTASLDVQIWDRWSLSANEGTGTLTILPTTLTLTYADARLRIRDLHDFEGLSVPQIALRLMAEGHVNQDGRRIWYHKAVRDALETGL